MVPERHRSCKVGGETEAAVNVHGPIPNDRPRIALQTGHTALTAPAKLHPNPEL